MTPRQEKLSSAAASDGLPLLPRGRNLCDDRPERWSTPSSRSTAGLVTSTIHGDLNGDLEQMLTCMGPMVWGYRGELRYEASVSVCAICLTINPKHSPLGAEDQQCEYLGICTLEIKTLRWKIRVWSLDLKTVPFTPVVTL